VCIFSSFLETFLHIKKYLEQSHFLGLFCAKLRLKPRVCGLLANIEKRFYLKFFCTGYFV
jgi:hypothetical protein